MPATARLPLTVLVLAAAGALRLALAPSPVASPPSAAAVRDLRLTNGLRVVIAADRAVPVVSIAVTYNVGSRDERPGRSGFAHLFEHLMFKGSEQVGPGEHFTLIFQNGGAMNATTDKDRTLYHDTVPAQQLDLALFLEADRMRSLAITPPNLDNQRRAVKEERRVRFDNQPYGRTEETLEALAYERSAYAHSVIGSMADLDAASIEDVASFFRTYYAPNNAVLSIAGDVDVDECAAKVRRYFESIPSQPAPPSVAIVDRPQPAERRQTLADPLAALARVDIAFTSAPRETAEDDALGVLATLLGGGRSSRLYARVVRQDARATAVTAAMVQRRGPGLFRITATVAPGQSAADVEAAIDAEIDRLKAEPVASWELEKARAAARMAIVSGWQSSATRAILLGQYALFHGDPGLVHTRGARIDAVTAADVARVARTYLVPANRSVVITEKPRAQTQTAGPANAAPMPSRGPGPARTPASAARAEAAVVMKGRAPVSEAPVRVRLPRPDTFDLPNGLHVIVLEDRRAPQISLNLVIPGAGGYFDPPDRPGLATFTAAMLREGTTTRASDAIARQLEILSASLEVTAGSASLDASITAVFLTEHLETVVDLLADLIVHPTFPDDELERYKHRTRASFVQQRASPSFLATELFARLVNGTHPAARTSPTPEALAATTSAALAAFHRDRYVPDHAVLLVVGDLSAADARRLLPPKLRPWRRGGRPIPTVSDPPAREGGGVHLVARPHSVQTSLMVGAAAIRRTSTDFYAVQVMNQVIGAGPTGRLFVHLREEKGYTYGAFSTLTAGPYRGWWSAATDVGSDVTQLALRDLLAEIARLRDEPVPEDELRRQQRAMVASFALTLESPRQLLGYYLTQWAYRLPADYWDAYPARIMAVTSADVRRVARRYLAPASLRIVAVGDPPSILTGLGDFGSVETYSPDAQRPK